jgi:phytoene synthase
MMALIRLQWWREVVEGARRRHEVAEPLRDALDAGHLQEADLLALIEGREAEPPDTDQAWADYVDATAGTLAHAAGRLLGAESPAIRAAGAAYGAAGVQRNRALSGQPKLAALQTAGQDWLRQARGGPIPRAGLAAALPAVFAARDLRRRTPVTERGVGDKLAVAVAAATGRL